MSAFVCVCCCDLRGRRSTLVFSRGSDVRPGAGWHWLGLLGLRRCAVWRWQGLLGLLYFGVLQGSDVRPGAGAGSDLPGLYSQRLGI